MPWMGQFRCLNCGATWTAVCDYRDCQCGNCGALRIVWLNYEELSAGRRRLDLTKRGSSMDGRAQPEGGAKGNNSRQPAAA